MKQLLLLIFILSCSLSRAQQWQWAFKTEHLDDVQTALTDDGSVYVTGHFQDSCLVKDEIIYGPSSPNSGAILLKFSANGIREWYRMVTGTQVLRLKADGNDVIIAGNMNGKISGLLNDSCTTTDIFFARISAQGQVIQYKRDGGPGHQTMNDMTIDHGNILVTGRFIDSASFSGHSFPSMAWDNGFLVRYTPTMSIDLAKCMISTGNYNASAGLVRTDSAGNIFICGYFVDTVRFGLTDTTIYFGPYYQYTSCIVQLSPAGKVRAVLPYMSGYFSHVNNFFPYQHGDSTCVMRINADGSCNHCCSATLFAGVGMNQHVQWSHGYGGGGDYEQDAQCMWPGDISTNGNMLLGAVGFSGNIEVGNDTLHQHGMGMVAMNYDGNFIYVHQLPYDLRPQQLTTIDPAGEVVLCGSFLGDAQFDNHVILGGTYRSCFIAKYSDPLLIGIPPVAAGPEMNLFPNPSQGDLEVSGVNGTARIELFSGCGACIQQFSFNEPHFHLSLPPGLYLYRITSARGVSCGKILINN